MKHFFNNYKLKITFIKIILFKFTEISYGMISFCKSEGSGHIDVSVRLLWLAWKCEKEGLLCESTGALFCT